MTNYAPYACEYCGRGPLNPHDGPLCEDCRVSPSCELCEEQARMRVPSSNLHLCKEHYGLMLDILDTDLIAEHQGDLNKAFAYYMENAGDKEEWIRDTINLK